jgi:hypothetical protein
MIASFHILSNSTFTDYPSNANFEKTEVLISSLNKLSAKY